MKKLIINLQRVPIYTFFLGLAACVVLLTASTAYQGENSSLDRSLVGCLFREPFNNSAGVLLLNVLDQPSSMGVWLITLFPVFAVMPYASGYCSELRTKGFYFSCSRMSHRSFCLSHFFACGIYSVLVMLGALVFTFLLCTIGCNHIFADVSAVTLFKLCCSYCVFAFTVGSICISLCSLMLDPFVICCGVSLVIYIMINVSSVYLVQFAAANNGEPNRLIYLLYIPDHARGFSQFSQLYGISRLFYYFAVVLVNSACAAVFYICTKRRVSQ